MKYVEEIDVENWVYRWPQVIFGLFAKFERMTIDTIDLFNDMCDAASEKNQWTYTINSDYRENGSGQHPQGRALDIVFFRKVPGDVDVLSQYLFALRFNWSGAGFYPHWNIPGIHLDTRQNAEYMAQWWRDDDGSYKNVDEYIESFIGGKAKC